MTSLLDSHNQIILCDKEIKTCVPSERNNLLYTVWYNWKTYVKQVKNKTLFVQSKEKGASDIISLIEKKMKQYKIVTKPSINHSPENSGNNSKSKVKSIIMKKNGISGTIYDRRYTAQAQTIAKQKLMLQHQKTMIEKLQTDQFKLRSELETKGKTANKTIICCTPNISNHKKNSSRITPMKTPEVLIRMQQREQARKLRWEALRERKHIMEFNKMQTDIEGEKKKKQRTVEERRQKLAELKNKQAQQKKTEELRTKARNRVMELTQMASKFYDVTLVKRTFRIWKLFVIKQITMIQSYHKKILLRNYFKHWKIFASEQINEKHIKARAYLEYIIKAKCFSILRAAHQYNRIKICEAEEWHNKMLKKSCLKKWIMYFQASTTRAESLSLLASNYYKRNLIKKCYRHWISYPIMAYEEREKEHRMRIWKNKIQEILPDFSLSSESDK